jgi:two-component sensor histidine kinase
MVHQTARQTESVPNFVAQFTHRIQGLAQSQDLMLRQNWQGAWMGDLVEAQLDLFAAGERAQVSGPPIFLNANAVQNIGFALHELATNASKHGALSVPDGRVVVTWSEPGDDGRIRLEWAERDGPTVASPLRQGFGNLVLTRLVAQALQGVSKIQFCPEGVRWELKFSTNHVTNVPVTTRETRQ